LTLKYCSKNRKLLQSVHSADLRAKFRYHLILRNSILTSARNLKIESITDCIVKNRRKEKSKIVISFLSNKNKSEISFVSDIAEKWIASFLKIGIKVDNQGFISS